jgi:transaldolase
MTKPGIKIFADGASAVEMLALAADPRIQGFTTNPSLMRKAGVMDYEAWARDLLGKIPDKPISFEVVADELAEMRRQALKIAAWGGNVYVKIPVTNTKGEPTYDLVGELSHTGVKANVTAVFSMTQVDKVCAALKGGAPAIISIFAGRIADVGWDPCYIVKGAVFATSRFPGVEILWASAREIGNMVQAANCGAHIITLPDFLISKLNLIGKGLLAYSLETVQQFWKDAVESGVAL